MYYSLLCIIHYYEMNIIIYVLICPHNYRRRNKIIHFYIYDLSSDKLINYLSVIKSLTGVFKYQLFTN